MVVECITIIAIIVLMSFIFLRSGKSNYAVATLPLALVPVCHVLSILFSAAVASVIGVRQGLIVLAVDLAALIFSCILYGFLSYTMSSKRSRKTYLFSSGAFSLILTFILVRGVVDSYLILG